MNIQTLTFKMPERACLVNNAVDMPLARIGEELKVDFSQGDVNSALEQMLNLKHQTMIVCYFQGIAAKELPTWSTASGPMTTKDQVDNFFKSHPLLNK